MTLAEIVRDKAGRVEEVAMPLPIALGSAVLVGVAWHTVGVPLLRLARKGAAALTRGAGLALLMAAHDLAEEE
jgi:hypothetical protein